MKMPPKKKKLRCNLTISEESRQILDKISKIEKRTMSDVLDFALQEINKKYENE